MNLIKEINFMNDRVQTHGHTNKDPNKRYITIRELGIFADTLCGATLIEPQVKILVKEYLLTKANKFLTLSKEV